MSTKSQDHLDPVDRALTTWIINFILNHKTQEEIAKDIDDGILDIMLVEEIFSRRYVEDLRQGNFASGRNYFNRFAQISDDRLKTILVRYFRQKDRNDLVNVINENANKMNEIQISSLWHYVLEKEESIDAVPSTSGLSRDQKERIAVGIGESSNAGKKGKGVPKKSDNSKTSSIVVVKSPDKQVTFGRKQTPSVGTKRRKQTTKKSVDPERSPDSSSRKSPEEQIIDENKESPNVETKRKRLTKKGDNSESSSNILSKSPDEEIVVVVAGSKDSPEVGTKGKQTARNGGKKGTRNGEKKGTKKSDEEKTQKKVEKPMKVGAATKKMAGDGVESKNAKAVGFRFDDENKVVEAIEEETSSKGDDGNVEEASTDPCDFTDRESRRNESEKLLSVTCQEDSSKNAESSGGKRKIILKLSKKKLTECTENISERDSKDMNLSVESTSSAKDERAEEDNETENKEIVIEKEEAGFAKKKDFNVSSETKKDEGFEGSPLKTANVPSLIGEEQGLRDNQNQEDRDVREYDDTGLQLDTSTPKKFDDDGNTIEVKKEPKDDCPLHIVIYYPTRQDQDKDANTEKDLSEELQVTNDEVAAEAAEAVSNSTDTTESINVKAEYIAKSPEEQDSTKEKAVVKVKKTKYKKRYDRSLDRRRRSISKQKKREELLKREKKIRNTMNALREQIIRLMNDVRHLETKSSSSFTDDNTETESSSNIEETISEEELPCIGYEDSEQESSCTITSEANIKPISDFAEHHSDTSHVSFENDSSKEDSDSDDTICTSSNFNEDMCNEYMEQDFTKDDDA